MLVFDIETDGLLDQLTHVKCLNIIDSETREKFRYTDYEHYEEPVCFLDAPWGDMKLHPLEVAQGNPTKRTGPLEDGLKLLEDAPVIGGHNVIGFDVPAIQVCYPEWKPTGFVRDSLVEARFMYNNIKQKDFAAMERGRLPTDFAKRGYVGSHSLMPWSIRIGQHLKTDWKPMYQGESWEEYSFSESCDDYCMDDVVSNLDVFDFFDAKGWDRGCYDTENRSAAIIHRQEKYGWLLDVDACDRLTADLLVRRQEIHERCESVFAPWYISRLAETHKRTMKRFVENESGPVHTRKKKIDGKTWTIEVRGWYQYNDEGVKYTPVERTVFNPGSRDHIADRLHHHYGWASVDFTPGGKPKIDESILEDLPYKEAQDLAEYFTVAKRLGQVSQGKNSWMKFVKDNGRVHGRVNSGGTVTGRMTHSKPNVGQVDKRPEMRACWIVPALRKLVGCDADGLELRCLGHYMAKFDGGQYVDIVLNGDVHWENTLALGLVPAGTERDKHNDWHDAMRNFAKTWIYAFLYGAGNVTLAGTIVNSWSEEKRQKFYAKYPPGDGRLRALARIGKKSRDDMSKGFPALAKLIKSVKAAAKRGWLKGLDGRRVLVRSEHAALNSLLQSAGAIIMKRALIILDDDLSSIYTNSSTCDGNPYDCDYEFVGNIHDEIQTECRQEIAHDVGQRAADAIRLAGEYYDFRCPTAGSYDIGDNWSQTH